MTQISDSESQLLRFADLQVFEHLSSPIWIYDVQQNQILWANSAARESWEVSSVKAINEGNGDSVQIEATNLIANQRQLLSEARNRVTWTMTHSEKRLRFDSLCSRIYLEGYDFTVLVEATPLLNEASNDCDAVAGVGNISDRAWNQRQLKEQTGILEAIATHQPLSQILRQLIRTLETLIPNRIGSFLLYDPKRHCLGSGEAINLPVEYLQALEGLPIGPKVGCCGTAAYLRKPVIVSNIATDPLWEEFRDLALRFHLKAAWSYPIFGENRALLGTFCCYSQKIEKPTPHDLDVTQMITHLAGLAITQDQVTKERDQKLALVEAAVDGIGIVENDCFCYLNQAHAEIFGYDSPDELVGCSWRILYSPEEAARLEQVMMPMLQQQGYWRGSAIGQRKDGTMFPQEISLTLVDEDKIICVGRDISDRAAVEQAWRESEKKYRSIFENITQGIFQVTLEGQYLNVNPFLAQLYGYDSPEDLIKNITNLAEELYVDPQRCHKLSQITLKYCTVKNFESQVYRKDGTKIWISVTQHAVYDKAGHFLFFEGVIEDITARKEAEDQLYYQAFHDGLTQLSNRTWFVQRLEGAIYAYEKGFTESCYAVFFIDLDRFKIINDSLGHITGDELLKQVADRFKSAVSDHYLIARFGGDEFALLATNINCQEDCSDIAQKLIDTCQDPFLLKGNRYFIGVSIGIAVGDLYYQTPEEVLRDADAAMYEAKAKGRGYVFFQPEIRERVLSCLLLENDLEGAIEREEFQLRYQHLVYLETNQLYGFEVLLRWIHPQRGAISPADFIPIAEQTGVIKELDAWVLKQSCRQLRQWQNQFSTAKDLVISVNLSPVELLQPNLVEQIADTLKEEGIAPHCIRLELTETAFLDNTRLDIFQQLQALGIQISIDDFGTGESSLSRLHQLPLSTIKVDRVFVQQLDQGHSGKALVQTILNLAHSLGVNTLSEGIETQQQRDTLLNLGCLLGQGYFYSPPVTAHAATQMLDQHDRATSVIRDQ
ncbi:diguanylate cyclase/phosphodiesterase with PAS/PAC and GAF sensor(s) [Halothece sp. PCC 7418]|uniref:sensor domain-containing phosphodiesterase n=1 Tax=Halothece sp. (strain PCC 7418) TaxID=65093 RepID=UPI0002A082FD|nr:EAL domain-containing protein [Halothece sp. PCC 7418]AFZ44577.1 diguanylate cyclase/phosphodiesterase with PAS/PAC and GAF sensor(s) [Halothece sp. PCC 7418]